ncbi:MAG TPA: hypothetical protein VGK02_01565 [Candidatus Aquicultor sp.]
MNTISNALDLYAELHALRLDPWIINGKLSLSNQASAHLIESIKAHREELFELIRAVDDKVPGACERCRKWAEDLFTVRAGRVCTACVDELLVKEGYFGEE